MPAATIFHMYLFDLKVQKQTFDSLGELHKIALHFEKISFQEFEYKQNMFTVISRLKKKYIEG